MAASQDSVKGEPLRWYFDSNRLKSVPSMRHGMDIPKELLYRQQAAQFIQDVGQKLQWPQLCMNTAIVYMHRFYVYHSFKDVPKNELATAALFLAGKVEENPRKLEHIVKVSYAIQHRDEPPLESGTDKFLDEAQRVVMFENLLLTTLGFDLRIDHPHTHVVKCCQLVKAQKDLAQASYFLATDSLLLTNFCLRYRPTIVACVCIFMACKWAGWEIPESHEGKPWFYYVDSSTNLALLTSIVEEFIDILGKSPQKLRARMQASRGEASSEAVPNSISPTVPTKLPKLEVGATSHAIHASQRAAALTDQHASSAAEPKRPHALVGHEPATKPRLGTSSPINANNNIKRVQTAPMLNSIKSEPASACVSIKTESTVEVVLPPLLSGDAAAAMRLAGSVAESQSRRSFMPDLSIAAALTNVDALKLSSKEGNHRKRPHADDASTSLEKSSLDSASKRPHKEAVHSSSHGGEKRPSGHHHRQPGDSAHRSSRHPSKHATSALPPTSANDAACEEYAKTVSMLGRNGYPDSLSKQDKRAVAQVGVTASGQQHQNDHHNYGKPKQPKPSSSGESSPAAMPPKDLSFGKRGFNSPPTKLSSLTINSSEKSSSNSQRSTGTEYSKSFPSLPKQDKPNGHASYSIGGHLSHQPPLPPPLASHSKLKHSSPHLSAGGDFAANVLKPSIPPQLFASTNGGPPLPGVASFGSSVLPPLPPLPPPPLPPIDQPPPPPPPLC